MLENIMFLYKAFLAQYRKTLISYCIYLDELVADKFSAAADLLKCIDDLL